MSNQRAGAWAVKRRCARVRVNFGEGEVVRVEDIVEERGKREGV